MDMPGVPRTLVEHKLGVKERTPPIKQKKRGQAPEKSKVAIELSEHDISYQPRTLIRGQVLADFLAEIPTKGTNQVEEATTIANEAAAEVWKLFTDVSSNKGGSGARLILTSLEESRKSWDQVIGVFVDSKLMANQINNIFQAKEETMNMYLCKTNER
ncbi:hypothetical protein Tco_0659347 [Tanacetum coccineum]